MCYLDFVLPADWASALVNGDYSSLDKSDRFALEDTLYALGIQASRCVTVSTSEFYTKHHDAVGIPYTNCLTYSFSF